MKLSDRENLKIRMTITQAMIPEGYCIRPDQGEQIVKISDAVVAHVDKLIDDVLVGLVDDWRAMCEVDAMGGEATPELAARAFPFHLYIAKRIREGDY